MKKALFHHNLMIFMIRLRSQNGWYRYIIVGQQANYVQFDNFITEINKNDHNSSQSGDFYDLYDVRNHRWLTFVTYDSMKSKRMIPLCEGLT